MSLNNLQNLNFLQFAFTIGTHDIQVVSCLVIHEQIFIHKNELPFS
jgi:hypothetical protein